MNGFTRLQNMATVMRGFMPLVRALSQVKMVKPLQKMVERGTKSKKKWYKNPMAQMPSSRLIKRSVSDGQKRRSEQVSKVLYGYITSIVNSGELSPDIMDMAVDIVKVKVIPDFSAVNVYWLSSGSGNDDKLEALLKQHESKLRQILISYHILGTIPQINFVQDKSAARYLHIEELLKTADYGPDFTPTDSYRGSTIRPIPQGGQDIKKQFDRMSLNFVDQSQFQNLTSMEDNNGSVGKLSAGLEENIEKPDLSFRSNIYGVPHSDIMERLMTKKQRVQKPNSDFMDDDSVKRPKLEDYEKHIMKVMKTKKVKKQKDFTYMDQMREEQFDTGYSKSYDDSYDDDDDNDDDDSFEEK